MRFANELQSLNQWSHGRFISPIRYQLIACDKQCSLATIALFSSFATSTTTQIDSQRVVRSVIMILPLLLVGSLVPFVSSQISCYDCPLAPKFYNYIVTTQLIPSDIQNCQYKSNQSHCIIDLRWYLTLERTGIDLGSDPERSQASSAARHTLLVTALMTGAGVTEQRQHSFRYRCSTDRCNDIGQLKRLLNSLTLESNFTDLKDLLDSSSPFDGHKCYLNATGAAKDCRVPADVKPDECTECSTKFTAEVNATELCATCVSNSEEEEANLARGVLFDLTDRSRTSSWSIDCRVPNCNGLESGRRIQEKSVLEFDFDRFFAKNTANGQTPQSLLKRIALLALAMVVPRLA